MLNARPAIIVAVAVLSFPVLVAASDDDSAAIKKAQETVALFRKADPSIKKFFENSVGYAVFYSVAKAGVGIGGAGGSGVLFENGKALGRTSLAQVTVGLQLGGQEFMEIIFFENAVALTDFKTGNFAFSAEVSAVAASAGAAAKAKYSQGVAVFTIAKGGLMFEASVGGQKFGFQPFGAKKK